jgi:hypothetical protein
MNLTEPIKGAERTNTTKTNKRSKIKRKSRNKGYIEIEKERKTDNQRKN